MAALTFNARAYAALSIFASTDATRSNLAGVYFEAHPTGDGVIAIAVDGHRLGIYYDRNGIIDRGPFILPVPKLAVAEARKVRNGDRMIWEDNALSFDNSPVRLNLDAIEGRFPDWRRVLPDVDHEVEPRTVATSGFNSRYVADFHEVGRILSGSRGVDPGRCITVHPPTITGCPSWVDLPAIPNFRGVLMPMPQRVAVDRPDWLADPAAVADIAA